MKMVMAVVPRDQVERVLDGLVHNGYTATFMDSRGGVLRQAQKMLFIATPDDDLESVLDIIRENCKTKIQVESSGETPPTGLGINRRRSEQPTMTTTEVGWASVFVWELDRFVTY